MLIQADGTWYVIVALRQQEIELDIDLPLVMLCDEDEQYMELPDEYIKTESYQRTTTTPNNHYNLLSRNSIVDWTSQSLLDTK